jgi:hypothetical protein
MFGVIEGSIVASPSQVVATRAVIRYHGGRTSATACVYVFLLKVRLACGFDGKNGQEGQEGAKILETFLPLLALLARFCFSITFPPRALNQVRVASDRRAKSADFFSPP